MKKLKFKLKVNKWGFRIFAYVSIIAMILLVVFLDPIVENHQNKNPLFCNNAKFLRTVEDDNDFFCYINCADKFGCNFSIPLTVRFEPADGSCMCDFLKIYQKSEINLTYDVDMDLK